MRKGWVIGGGLALLLAAAVGAALISGAGRMQADGGKDGKDKPVPALEFAPSEVTRPLRSAMPEQLAIAGSLVAPGTAVLRAKGAGTLTRLSVGEGSRVRAGQALGEIDMPELDSRVAERDANVAAARAALAQAQRSFASNERLAAQQFISPIALDNSRAAVDTAQAQLAAAQASLQTLRVGRRDRVLVAPIAGIVAKRHVLPGEKISPEQTVLTLVDLARLELAGTVGTHEVSRLSAGMAVQVRVEGLNDPVPGRIARIAPAAEAGTRAIGVTIAVDNPQESLRAGQYAVAQAMLADDAQRLTVPVNAVAQSAGLDHVWVIEAGVLARRAVTLGRRDPAQGRVEVLTGLDESTQVLAARFENLREGAKARLAVPTALASASGPAAGK